MRMAYLKEEEEGVGSQVVYFLQKEYLLLEGYLELHIRHLHPAGYKSIFYKKKNIIIFPN